MKVMIQRQEIADFARRWRITEFAIFGSVLRDDFKPDSDIDVLVSFDPEAHWTLFDMHNMREELKQIFGREVDLISRRGLESSKNTLRKQAIFSTAQVIYAA